MFVCIYIYIHVLYCVYIIQYILYYDMGAWRMQPGPCMQHLASLQGQNDKRRLWVCVGWKLREGSAPPDKAGGLCLLCGQDGRSGAHTAMGGQDVLITPHCQSLPQVQENVKILKDPTSRIPNCSVCRLPKIITPYRGSLLGVDSQAIPKAHLRELDSCMICAFQIQRKTTGLLLRNSN